jgi:hypothetical protein
VGATSAFRAWEQRYDRSAGPYPDMHDGDQRIAIEKEMLKNAPAQETGAGAPIAFTPLRDMTDGRVRPFRPSRL